ncbi:MAG: hypothetical protein ACQEST_10865 [Bacteroidota bacterium]
MIQSDTFGRTVVCGFIATFIMTMISFLLGGIGLPVIDIGYILQAMFNHIHDHDPYSILWGNTAYYIFGIIIALLWVIFLQKRIPGNWMVQGMIFGVIISLVAGLIISPLVSTAVGEPFGIFYSDTWFPVLTLLAGLIMHLGYGLVLTVSLKYAGVVYPE